ncbi:hypothetical protein GGI17_004295 [Coemansia sp. S146]|nr:hypothetical protein GGI17_004295 [Coemansia sp. S146]
MALDKYTFLAVSLTLAYNSAAEMAEVGYAPQTLVAVQQYMINRPNLARDGDMHGHGHVYERAGQDNSDGGESEDGESADFKDFELSSSKIKDNSAASSCGGYSVLTVLLAAATRLNKVDRPYFEQIAICVAAMTLVCPNFNLIALPSISNNKFMSILEVIE